MPFPGGTVAIMAETDEAPRRRTGEYVAVHDDTAEHPLTAPELRRALTWSDLRAAGLVLVAVVASTVTGWQLLTATARAQATEAGAEVTRRVQAIEDAGRRHADESAAVHHELKQELAELQRDIRELYRVVRDPSRRSERLEQPAAVDGGSK